MKTKFLLSTLLLFIVFSVSNAQLKVTSSGQVQANNQTLIQSSENCLNDGLDVVNNNPSLANGVDLVWVKYNALQPNNPGLLTLQSANGAYFSVRANGKVGIFNSDPSVALEIGTTGSNEQVKVNGTLVLGSDERIKENIKDINNSLNQLKQLRTVSYTFKEKVVAKDTTNSFSNGGVEKNKFTPKSNPENKNRNHYGFLAQDVQKFFPDLVYKDSAGMFSVDYIGMIPLMLDALKSQQAQIDAQASQIAALYELVKPNSGPKKVGANPSPTTSTTDVEAISYPVLDQNIPNPFNTATTIGFSLPTTTTTASVYVYDMNGVQLKSYPIAQRGKGNITIQGSEFNAGMYLYALIADGKVIDTKRMILTK